MTDEEFVRAYWETGIVGRDIYGYGLTLPTNPPHTRLGYEKKSQAWAAAAEFTRDRLEQIRQLEAEIEAISLDVRAFSMNEKLAVSTSPETAIYSRILARLEAALADLQRGMRTAAPDGHGSDAND